MEIQKGKMRSYEARLARVELRHAIPHGHEHQVEMLIRALELEEKRKLDNSLADLEEIFP